MKRSAIIRTFTVAALAFICNLMYSGNTEPDSLCLRLIGKVSKTPESAGHTYTVQLIDNSKVIATQVVKAGKNFKLDVRRNGWYGVRIKNEDGVTKLISVNTHLPRFEFGDAYLLNFEMEEPFTLVESKQLDSDAIDFPLALISYEKEVDNFNYNEEYTKNIKNELLSPLINDKKDVAMNDKDQAGLKNRQAIIK